MLIPSGKRKKGPGENAAARSEEASPPQVASRVTGGETTVTPPARATRPVTAAELLQVREDKPLIPIDQVTGKWTSWTFRHPDVDGSGYTGPVYVARVDRYLAAEGGYVRTEKAEERDALAAMGWILWHTEIPDARPVRLSNSL